MYTLQKRSSSTSKPRKSTPVRRLKHAVHHTSPNPSIVLFRPNAMVMLRYLSITKLTRFNSAHKTLCLEIVLVAAGDDDLVDLIDGESAG